MTNTVKLSKETIETLTKAAQIFGSLKIMPNESCIVTRGDPSTIIMKAPIEEQIPREFNIYDLKLFLKTLTLVEDSLIDFTDDHSVVIYNESGTVKTTFRDATPDLIKTYIDPSRIPDLESESFTRFKVPASDFEHIVRVTRTLGHNYIGFRGDGEHVFLTAFNLQGSGEKTDTFDIVLGDSDQVFYAFYKLELSNISVWSGEGDLDVKISERGISCIDTETGKRFLTVLDEKSTFDK